MVTGCSVRVRGVVQGVGFRPFVYRLASANELAGWVLNGADGVEIRLEGPRPRVLSFLEALRASPPPAAVVAGVEVSWSAATGLSGFVIRDSHRGERPTTRVSPDLAVCAACLRELLDPADPRFHYPYINCTDCGPRYSIILRLPYDRDATTMHDWTMDRRCRSEYDDPGSRRFHAQPVACPECGPHLRLLDQRNTLDGDDAVVARAAALLRDGRIVAVKGIGGFHLSCDARNPDAVRSLRDRKFRKEKPFALMARDLDGARRVAVVSPESESLLGHSARPIVLVEAREVLAGVAPDNTELGLMLPYTPLHHLLFAAGAPDLLVMTSANRSSEPIAYRDDDALESLTGIADAFLMGDRPIARRVEDSIARVGPQGPVILRRGRGYAPGAVAAFPAGAPILALGADLKNAITLVVDGQAFVSQHIGDLEDAAAYHAFAETIDDLLAMYEVPRDQLVVARDLHPQYLSTRYAGPVGSADSVGVQHHRAHVASVLAERGMWEERVLGISFDGTGYGDDGTIWGGEFFAGSLAEGLVRVGHLRRADLVGGDAAARHPVQAAAGFTGQLDGLPDLEAAPFHFPARYRDAMQLFHKRVRTFVTTSTGRLFDAAAALLGFTRPVTYEGQAAIWLEHLARGSSPVEPYAFPFTGGELDFRPLLLDVARDRASARRPAEIARAFHAGVARGTRDAAVSLCDEHGLETVVVSGGVFQNALLMADLHDLLGRAGLELHANRAVPPNDGGISLGQAAVAASALRVAAGGVVA
jgi:hydrogenase maturation protein HypF